MAKKVLPGKLSEEIMRYLKEYEEDIEEVTKDLTTKISKEAKAEVKSLSPSLSGEYKKSWSVRVFRESKRYYVKIHNRNKYQLTHLLEFGHINRDGTTRAKKIPHIRNTENKYMDKLVSELEKQIRRGV